MQVTKSVSVEGQTLISVTFRKQTPEAAAPMVEVVFEVFIPAGLFTDSSCALFPLSTTRIDTREKITLEPDERREAREKALEYAATLTRDD